MKIKFIQLLCLILRPIPGIQCQYEKLGMGLELRLQHQHFLAFYIYIFFFSHQLKFRMSFWKQRARNE